MVQINSSRQLKTNQKLDELISLLQQQLSPLQRDLEKNVEENSWPVGLIVGAPRSGTTLLLQWLGQLGCFSYPSNFLNRFAYAPSIGAMIQKMIFDPEYDFAGEFSDLKSDINYSSALGKSKGALATSEFQHFFRNYMEPFEPSYLDDQALKGVDFHGIRRGLASIAESFGKPFVTKAMMLQYNLVETAQYLNNTVFLYVERDPLMTMQSIFLARKAYYGSQEIWWSCKPREYAWLKDLDCYHQIAGQVFFTNRSIRKELSHIPAKRNVFIRYEEFCRFPNHYFDEIKSKFLASGYDIKQAYSGPEGFDVQQAIKIDKEDYIRLQEAYNHIRTENDGKQKGE